MIERFIDPERIDADSDCIQTDYIFSGEKVRDGKIIHGFELAEAGRVEREGVEVIGTCEDRMGIHAIVEGVSDDSAQAIESLFSEVISRMRGVEYRFRKENVVIAVSGESLDDFTPECAGKTLFRALKSIEAVKRVKVRIICDRDEFERVKKRAEEIHAEREKRSRDLRDEDVREFYLCESCKVYLPYHACIITPERPSPCGTLYGEAKAAKELEVVGYYSSVEKGEAIDQEKGEYRRINEEIERRTDSRVKRVKIHSILENPPLTGNFAQAIVFYIPEKDGFGIVDRSFREKTPIGLRFDEMEKFILGAQVEGFAGISFAYMRSEGFLRGEGGWSRVVWVSPKVYSFIREFLPERILKNISTEKRMSP